MPTIFWMVHFVQQELILRGFWWILFPNWALRLAEYKLSHGKSVSNQQQREKQIQARKQPVNTLRAGLHSLNIEKLFLAFTSGSDCCSILVTGKNPFGHHWSTDVNLVCCLCISYVRVFKLCSQELLSLALNRDQSQIHCQRLCKISLGFSPLHN